MREVVLDTETTGLDAARDRIVEIGCVELVDHMPTGQVFQRYLNPGRPVAEAERIHGIADAFLADKPVFADIAAEMLEFIGGAPLVIHNAAFDIRFLNAELQRAGRTPIDRARAIDTIEIAKARLPGMRYSLDDLCRRFGIDLAGRVKHGALIDATLTARIYLELVGRQSALTLDVQAEDAVVVIVRPRPYLLPPRITPEELAAHAAFVSAELGPDHVWAL